MCRGRQREGTQLLTTLKAREPLIANFQWKPGMGSCRVELTKQAQEDTIRSHGDGAVWALETLRTTDKAPSKTKPFNEVKALGMNPRDKQEGGPNKGKGEKQKQRISENMRSYFFLITR